MECYRRARGALGAAARGARRADGPWKRGVGLASQIWYGGGGPPSYAWVRVGSDGRVNVVTAMQDIGTGTRTAMAQIAAEELGASARPRRVELGDSARGPYASISAGSSTVPSMGPAVRSAAADAARQILEIAAQRFERRAARALAQGRQRGLGGRRLVAARGGDGPARRRADPRQGRARPEPGRDARAHLRRAGGGGRGRRRDRRGARGAGRRDPRRRPDRSIRSARAARSRAGSSRRSGTRSPRQRLDDPATGGSLTRTLDAYKLPTIADVPEIVAEFVDVPDEHLTNLGSKGLGEPPIIPTAAAIANAIRDATGADVRSLPITREEMLRALREARERTGSEVAAAYGLARSRRRRRRSATARPALAGGTELVPLLRDRIIQAETLVELTEVVPRGDPGDDDRRRDDARRARGRPDDPEGAARGLPAGGLAAGARMGTIGGNLLQSTRCWYWRLKFPCRLHGGERCLAQAGRAARARDLRQRALRLGAPVRPGRRAGRARRARCGRPARARRSRSSTASRPTDDRSTTTLAARRADPRARRSRTGSEHVPEGHGPARRCLPARRGRRRALPATTCGSALAGVAPIPWPLASVEALDGADAAARHRLQGRARAGARRAARPRRSIRECA